MERKIAIIQQGPVLNDLVASMERAKIHIRAAASKGAQLVVFGECWLSGYPVWIDYCPDVARWDHGPVKEVWAEMYENSAEIEGPEIAQLCSLAEELKITLVMGINEVVRKGKGNGTIYNSLITITPDGNLANHHRKLMPTFNEKLIHGLGDGHGLRSVDTPMGQIGGLICWEHFMPLTRQSLHDAGEDIHIAVWPQVLERHQLASRFYAFEGRCIVIAVGQTLAPSSIPPSLNLPKEQQKEAFLLRGGSCVIGPDGNYLLEPQMDTEDILYLDLPPKETAIQERMNLATSGHYQRYDVFQFKVNHNRHTDI